MPVVDALYRQAMKLTNDPDEMIELAREVRPDILHIAGDGYAADEAFAARLKEAAPNTKLMQAVLVDDESAVDNTAISSSRTPVWPPTPALVPAV